MQLPASRSETVFEDFKPALTDVQATIEANRCLFCSDAPCIKACPTGIDIPQFIRKIGTGNVKGAAKTILSSNILGMSCARVCPVEVLCVGDCVYNLMEEPPIQIGKLQRYATDMALENDWRFFEAGAATGKSVGLLGAGPASLAAAHELRRLGHACTLYDKRDILGGLNSTGVAPYKMRADAAQSEIDYVLKIGGVQFESGVTIGDAATLETLEKKHDAMLIGLGLGDDTRLGVPGETLAGVHGAVAFIEALKLTEVHVRDISRAVVVGGGNTAVDAVRELLGLGIPEVVLMYRGTQAQMSGYEHEWDAAKQEGARGMFGALPTAFLGDSQVTGIRFGKVDANKRLVAGTETELDAQLVLLAIGQAKLGALFRDLAGVEVDKGRIMTDAQGKTGRRGWYAAGDCKNGGKEVVNAVAEGRDAARAIHTFLTQG